MLEIMFVQSLTEAEIDELWELYDTTFRPLNRKSPCRQSFYEPEFREAMFNPDIFKLGTFVDGDLMSMAIWSRNLECFPWLSRDFFAARYPELYASKGITYVVGLLTKPEAERRGYGSASAKQTTEEILAHGGLMVVDVCDANADLPRVAAEHYFGKYANVEQIPLGTQSYWGLQFTPLAA